MTDLTKVTRIHLRTDLGQYEFWADNWEPEIQDDGLTLYFRGRGTGTHAKARRDIALTHNLTDAIEATPQEAE